MVTLRLIVNSLIHIFFVFSTYGSGNMNLLSIDFCNEFLICSKYEGLVIEVTRFILLARFL